MYNAQHYTINESLFQWLLKEHGHRKKLQTKSFRLQLYYNQYGGGDQHSQLGASLSHFEQLSGSNP